MSFDLAYATNIVSMTQSEWVMLTQPAFFRIWKSKQVFVLWFQWFIWKWCLFYVTSLQFVWTNSVRSDECLLFLVKKCESFKSFDKSENSYEKASQKYEFIKSTNWWWISFSLKQIHFVFFSLFYGKESETLFFDHFCFSCFAALVFFLHLFHLFLLISHVAGITAQSIS